jgi:cytochrome c
MNQLRNPRQQMAVYPASILPDQDAADIYAFLKSQPQPKKVADIPLLNSLK